MTSRRCGKGWGVGWGGRRGGEGGVGGQITRKTRKRKTGFSRVSRPGANLSITHAASTWKISAFVALSGNRKASWLPQEKDNGHSYIHATFVALSLDSSDE